MNRTLIHASICKELNETYARKNRDYGDSFAKLRQEFPDAILIRLADKYNRLKTLRSGQVPEVRDESITDTLLDMANYCIMEAIEMKIEAAADNHTVEEYSGDLLRTVNVQIGKDSLLMGALGLSGETGEVVDEIKKSVYQGHTLDTKHLAEELGDVLWYLNLIGHTLGYELTDLLKMNSEKRKERYPDGFEESKSINRKENIKKIFFKPL